MARLKTIQAQVITSQDRHHLSMRKSFEFQTDVQGMISVLHNTQLEFDFSKVLETNEVVGLLVIGCFFVGTKSFLGCLAKSEIDVSDTCAPRFKKSTSS